MNNPLEPTVRTYVARADIKPDKTQPRRTFTGLQELADTFGGKPEGILETLKVRVENGYYILIDGERRWRAAELAKLDRVPVEIIAPADVLKTQLIFATQRANLTALEEAAAYTRLLTQRRQKQPDFSVATLAKELGRSRSTLYELFTLNKAHPDLRAALEAGTLDLSKAVLIASCADQPGAVKRALHKGYSGELPTVRDLKEIIKEDFQRSLSGVPWKLDDAELVPKAGPCTSCPKRSGNQEIFSGQNPNICTDPDCFEDKVAAQSARVLKTAKAEGAAVVPAQEYERHRTDFAEAKETPWQDKKNRTWGQLAKSAKVAPAITVEEGHRVEVFTPEAKKQILEAHKIKEWGSGGDATWRKAQKKLKQKETLYEAVARAAAAQMLDALVLPPKLGNVWPILARAALDVTGLEEQKFLCKRRGWTEDHLTPQAVERVVAANLKKIDKNAVECARLVIETLICARWNGAGWHQVGWSANFEALCQVGGVSLAKLLKAASAPAKKPKKTGKTAAQNIHKMARCAWRQDLLVRRWLEQRTRDRKARGVEGRQVP